MRAPLQVLVQNLGEAEVEVTPGMPVAEMSLVRGPFEPVTLPRLMIAEGLRDPRDEEHPAIYEVPPRLAAWDKPSDAPHRVKRRVHVFGEFYGPILEELVIQSHALTRLPVAVCALPFLRVLDLFRNQLETLPGEVGQLTALQQLRLGTNRLRTLPRTCANLTNLIDLSLAGV